MLRQVVPQRAEGEGAAAQTQALPQLLNIQREERRTLAEAGLDHSICLTLVAVDHGQYVATAGSDGTVLLWRASDGLCLAVFAGHLGAVTWISFRSDSSLILTASTDRTAMLWRVDTGECQRVLEGHADRLYSAVFSPANNNLVLTASGDRCAKLWSLRTSSEPVPCRTFRGHRGSVTHATFSPDGAVVLTASLDWTARLWDSASGKCLRVLQGHTSGLYAAAFSEDGERILTASADRTAKLWNTYRGILLRNVGRHAEAVTSVAFFGDADRHLTGSVDGTARIWRGDACLGTLRGPGPLTWVGIARGDGDRVLTAHGAMKHHGGGGVGLWEVEAGGGRRVRSFSAGVPIVAAAVSD